MGIQPEKEREGEGERVREVFNPGEARFPRKQLEKLVHPLLLEKLFILLIVHRDQWIIQNYAASAALTLIETRLSLCTPSCIHKSQVIYIIFQPEGQLTFYGPFLIRVCQLENLKSVVLPKVWFHSQKALNKITFLHSKDTTICNKKEECSDL